MPANKDFQRRIEILDECLRRRQRQWTIQCLLEEVNRKLNESFGKGIGQRSLYDDLNYLNYELDAPIEKYKDGKKTCYRYADPDFSIRNIPVKQEEVMLMRDAIELLSQVGGFQIAEEMLAVVNRLENTVATNIHGRHAIIQFEKNGMAAGTQWLTDLFEAVKDKTVLKITYQPFGKEPLEHIFHPYLLKEYRNRWFVIGRIGDKQIITNLALDRIIKLKPLRDAFLENDLFNPDSYYDALIGVSWPEHAAPETVTLTVSAALYPYIQTKPIHSSQRVVKERKDGTRTIELHLVNNHELRSQLLGLGPGLVVKSPDSLRNQMKELYTAGSQLYS